MMRLIVSIMIIFGMFLHTPSYSKNYISKTNEIRFLTTADGKKLVLSALHPAQRILKDLKIDLYSGTNTSANLFYFFEVTWDNPGGGVVVGNFAVNKINCDVWNLSTERKILSKNLISVQTDTRKNITCNKKFLKLASSISPFD